MPFHRPPIFVGIFDALPIQVAEGIAIVESDVAENIEVEFFGQRLTLLTLHSPITTEMSEIIFTGAMTHP